MILNREERSVEVKLVYYGPAMSGKTTNLQVMHSMMPEADRAPLTSLKTEGDRTLFFDFLPIQLELAHGWTIRLKTYTVPGQVQYEATRQLILKGADGIAFIADSHPNEVTNNRTAFQGMKANLRAQGLDPRVTPIVLQYNKRDLPDATSVEALEGDLNTDGLPFDEAVAFRGIGVRETFRNLAARTIGRVLDDLRLARVPAAKIHAQVNALLTEQPDVDVEAREDSSVYDLGATPSLDPEQGQADLLRQAVSGAADLAADLAAANAKLKRLGRRSDELAWLASCADGTDEDVARLLAGAVAATGASAGALSVLTDGEPGPLETVACHGIAEDPLNRVPVPGLGTVARQLAFAGRPVLTHAVVSDLLYGTAHPDVADVSALVAVPLVSAGKPAGLLTLLAAGDCPWLPARDELAFARAAAGLLTPRVLRARLALTLSGSPGAGA